jgi:arabinofuranosyltransferase
MKTETATQSRHTAIGWSTTAVSWMTLAWAILLAALCLHKNWRYEYDDAFITMRYARHLIEGYGPRWNLSGEPVEGYSSPLHMLLLAALGMARIPLLLSARVVGFVSHAALVVFLWNFMRRRDGKVAAALVSALVIASWPMLVWDLGGLESTLFAATLAMGTLVTLEYIDTGRRRNIVAGGALLGLAVFVRPDGALMTAMALLACLVLGQVVPLRIRIADITLATGACALMVLPWEIFRLSYYHAALPNTYYAKVYGIPLGWRVMSGIQYWRIYVRNAPFFALMLFVIGIAVLAKRRLTRFDAGLWACVIAYAAYTVVNGGDHMPGFRFMVPLVSLMAVALVRGLVGLGGLRTGRTAAAVSLALMLASARQMAAAPENPSYRDWAGLMGEEIGHYITAQWPPGSVVGVNVAGTTAYFADSMNFIDMLGLNDREIANRKPVPMNLPTIQGIGHMKGDGASVHARRPEYIIPMGGNGPLLKVDDRGHFLTEYELARLPDFWKEYEPCETTLSMSKDAVRELPRSFEFIYYQRRGLRTPCPMPK